jgi:flagellar biosynthesis protein FlhB
LYKKFDIVKNFWYNNSIKMQKQGIKYENRKSTQSRR